MDENISCKKERREELSGSQCEGILDYRSAEECATHIFFEGDIHPHIYNFESEIPVAIFVNEAVKRWASIAGPISSRDLLIHPGRNAYVYGSTLPDIAFNRQAVFWTIVQLNALLYIIYTVASCKFGGKWLREKLTDGLRRHADAVIGNMDYYILFFQRSCDGEMAISFGRLQAMINRILDDWL